MPINQITHADLNLFAAYPSLDQYQRVAAKSALYPGQGTQLGLAYCALKLNGEAGELAEHVGKAMRDDELITADQHGGCWFRDLKASRRALMIKEVGDVLWYASALCNELGISLTYAATQNLLKIQDRGERGALQGSGDER